MFVRDSGVYFFLSYFYNRVTLALRKELESTPSAHSYLQRTGIICSLNVWYNLPVAPSVSGANLEVY